MFLILGKYQYETKTQRSWSLQVLSSDLGRQFRVGII